MYDIEAEENRDAEAGILDRMLLHGVPQHGIISEIYQ